MAESFGCCAGWVDFTNGAVESLFECWERLARADAGRPGMGTLASYLRRAIDHRGPGDRAFGMDREYLPDELAGPAELAALIVVVGRTATDPTLVSDVNWSPELLASWRERLGRLVEALRVVADGQARG